MSDGTISFSCSQTGDNRGHYSATVYWSANVSFSKTVTKSKTSSKKWKYNVPLLNRESQKKSMIQAAKDSLPGSMSATISKSYTVHVGGSTSSFTISKTITLDRQYGNGSTSSGEVAHTDDNHHLSYDVWGQATAKYSKKGTASGSKSGSIKVSLGHSAKTVTCYAKGLSGSATFKFSKWPSYTVSYDGNGATSGSVKSQTKWKDEALTTRKNGYKKTGYHNDGKWHGGGYSISFGGKYKGNSGITFKPHWIANTWYIDYVDDDSTHPGATLEHLNDIYSNPPSTACTYDENVKLAKATNYWHVPGYDFKGWKRGDRTYSQEAILTKPNWTSTNKGRVTIKGVWDIKEIPVYFYSNKRNDQPEAATFISSIANETGNSSTRVKKIARYGQSFTYLNKNKLNPRARYSFVGWSKSETANSANNNSGTSFTWKSEDSVNYYAIWKDTKKNPKPRNRILGNVFRSNNLGIENDSGTSLHINELTFTPLSMSGTGVNKYYTTTLTISYRLAGTLGATQLTSITVGSNTGDANASIGTLPPFTETNTVFNINSEYEIIYTLSYNAIPGLITDSYRFSESTMIYAAAFPFDIRQDKEMVGFQTAAAATNKGVVLGGSTASKTRDIYLGINTDYTYDSAFLSALGLLNINNIVNQNLNNPAAMEIRDDGHFVSFGKQTSNTVTTKAINGSNIAYYGINLNDNTDPADIYYNLNSNPVDKEFLEGYKKLTGDITSSLTTPQGESEGLSFSADGKIAAFGGEYIKPEQVVPSAYRQLEYIETSGTQYIRTGFIPTNNSKIKIEYCYMSNSKNKGIFGANNSNYYIENYITSNNTFGYSAGHSSNGIDYNVNTNKYYNNSRVIFELDLYNNSLKISGGVSYTKNLSISSGTYDTELGLGIINNQNYWSNTPVSGLRIYSCQLYNNNVLQNNFIPCQRIVDGVNGLYDTVSKSFKTNGSISQTNFLAGPSIYHTGWLIQPGTASVMASSMMDTRDIYFIDYELEQKIINLFGAEYVSSNNTLTINRVNTSNNEYGYLTGQTWQDWVNCEFNTNSFIIQESKIYIDDLETGYLIDLETGSAISPNDKISVSISYGWSHEYIISFTINEISYNAIRDYSWQAWFNTIFNTTDFVLNNNNLYLYSTFTDVSTVSDGEGGTENIETDMEHFEYVTYNGSYVNTNYNPIENASYTLTIVEQIKQGDNGAADEDEDTEGDAVPEE